MYCVNCSIADILNDEANQMSWYGMAACERVKQMARNAHAECEDPKNCTCKHIVGLVLNPDEVAALQRPHSPSWVDDPRNQHDNG